MVWSACCRATLNQSLSSRSARLGSTSYVPLGRFWNMDCEEETRATDRTALLGTHAAFVQSPPTVSLFALMLVSSHKIVCLSRTRVRNPNDAAVPDA
eukprot:scaffold3243_cov47-Attheya_sp.AAC.8